MINRSYLRWLIPFAVCAKIFDFKRRKICSLENPFPSSEPFGKEGCLSMRREGTVCFLQLFAAACQKHKNHKLKMKWQLGIVRKGSYPIKNASSVRYRLKSFFPVNKTLRTYFSLLYRQTAPSFQAPAFPCEIWDSQQDGLSSANGRRCN